MGSDTIMCCILLVLPTRFSFLFLFAGDHARSLYIRTIYTEGTRRGQRRIMLTYARNKPLVRFLPLFHFASHPGPRHQSLPRIYPFRSSSTHDCPFFLVSFVLSSTSITFYPCLRAVSLDSDQFVVTTKRLLRLRSRPRQNLAIQQPRVHRNPVRRGPNMVSSHLPAQPHPHAPSRPAFACRLVQARATGISATPSSIRLRRSRLQLHRRHQHQLQARCSLMSCPTLITPYRISLRAHP